MTDYSSWSHQQMYDAVLSADPAAMANAASHWTQCAGNWATGSWGVSDGLEKLIPQWSGQGASACYGWTTDLLDRNIAFQGSLNQASKVMLDLSRSVYQAQISMPEVPDADIQAAANGQPTLAQLKAAAQQNGLLPNSHTALAGAMDDITLPLAQKDPNSPIHQAAVAAAQQQVNAARGQAIQVAQTSTTSTPKPDNRCEPSTPACRTRTAPGTTVVQQRFLMIRRQVRVAWSLVRGRSSMGRCQGSRTAHGVRAGITRCRASRLLRSRARCLSSRFGGIGSRRLTRSSRTRGHRRRPGLSSSLRWCRRVRSSRRQPG
jgi:hypothetical protein